MRNSAALQRTIVLVCLSVTIIGMLPVFLIAALAGEIQADLAARESTIGILVAVFFAVSAVMSMPGGRFTQRVGWPVGIIVVSLAVAVCAILIAAIKFGILFLGLCLVIAGVGNGLSHPAANLGLVRSISPARRGMAFGIKQAAIPASTLLAGAALPLIAVRFGWRAPFVVLAVFALLVGLLACFLRERVDQGRAGDSKRIVQQFDRRGIFLLSAGAGLGSAAANSMGAFLVIYALDFGAGPGAAGALLMAGSLANIVVRLQAGWKADRRSGGHLRVVAVMMFVGSGGVLIIAIAPNMNILVLGTLVAFGVGWGWNGLLHHGAMVLYSEFAAGATSIIQGCLFVGAVIGPLTFGLVAEYISFRLSWLLVAVWLACGAILVLRFRGFYLRKNLAEST